MAKSYAVGLGAIGLALCAGLAAIATGAFHVSAPVVIPIFVIVIGPMLAAGALIATCSVAGPPLEVAARAEVEVTETA